MKTPTHSIAATAMTAAALAASIAAPLRAAENNGPAHSFNPEYVAKALAAVPAEDPKPGKPVPKLKSTTRPYLVFDAAFIADLKKRAEADPVLQNAVENALRWASRPNMFKPDSKPDVTTGDTPALANGFGSYPMLAFAYAMDPKPETLGNIRQLLENMVNAEYWTHNALEINSNMGAGNCMFFVALLYDVARNDLEPGFRKQVAEKLLHQARHMYYLGYKELGPYFMPRGYWQCDPHNNHRWHRGCGQVAALLAIAPDVDGRADFFLQEAQTEIEFILKYFSPDGDYSEGCGYQAFGYMYLALQALMFDRSLGTDYLATTPGFRDAWKQQVYYSLPATNAMFSFGDDSNGALIAGNLNGAFFLGPKLSRDKQAFAAYKKFYEDRRPHTDPTRPMPAYPWSFLLFYDSTLAGGDHAKEPLIHIAEDFGGASFRDSWDKDAVVFTFKCGPAGGYGLNRYRHDTPLPDGRPHYINIAHDDPDAGAIALAKAGNYYLHPGNYSTAKLTSNANTILVDGKGQKLEGDAYLQPHRTADMREFSYLVGWKTDAQNRAIIEGEAGAAYAGLETFRRSCVWLPGDYILMLDNIEAKTAAKLTHHSLGRFFFTDPAAGKLYATPTGPGDLAGKMDDFKLPFQVLSNRDLDGSNAYYALAGRWTNYLINSLSLSATDKTIRFATLFDAWDKNVSIDYSETTEGIMTIKVTGDGINDVWIYTPAAGRDTPSLIRGTRAGKELITLTAKDLPPREGWTPAPAAPHDDPRNN